MCRVAALPLQFKSYTPDLCGVWWYGTRRLRVILAWGLICWKKDTRRQSKLLAVWAGAEYRAWGLKHESVIYMRKTLAYKICSTWIIMSTYQPSFQCVAFLTAECMLYGILTQITLRQDQAFCRLETIQSQSSQPRCVRRIDRQFKRGTRRAGAINDPRTKRGSRA